MARIRTIKPDFFLNDELSDLEPLTRLFFIGLWTQADREGRMEYRPKRLKAALVPYDECDIDTMVSALESRGHVTRYEVDGTEYLSVENFVKHQAPNIKEKQSTVPARIETCKHSASTMPARIGNSLMEGKGREGKGREGKTEDTTAEEFRAKKPDREPSTDFIPPPSAIPTPPSEFSRCVDLIGTHYATSPNDTMRQRLHALCDSYANMPPCGYDRLEFAIGKAASLGKPNALFAIGIAQNCSAHELTDSDGKQKRKQPKCPACSDTLTFHDAPCDMCDAGREASRAATAVR